MNEEKLIMINGVIDEANGINIINQLQEIVNQVEAIVMYNDNCRYGHMVKPTPSLKIIINSPGGSVAYGTSIISMIEDLKDMGCLVITIAQFAYSMGFCIWMSGDLRYFGNDKLSTVMHHQCSAGTIGTLTEMQNDIDEYKKQEVALNEYIAERSNMTLELQEQHKHENWFIRHDEAVELGLINEDIKKTGYYKQLQEQGIVPKEVEDKKEEVKEEIGEVGEEASNDVKEEIGEVGEEASNDVKERKEDMSYIKEMISNCDGNCGICEYFEECGGELLWLIKEDKLDELIEALRDEDELDELIEALRDEDELDELIEVLQDTECDCDGSCEECTCHKSDEEDDE